MLVANHNYKTESGMDFMTEIIMATFCDVDDFCKAFEYYCKTHLLPENAVTKGFFQNAAWRFRKS